jgi:hypothetical protein
MRSVVRSYFNCTAGGIRPKSVLPLLWMAGFCLSLLVAPTPASDLSAYLGRDAPDRNAACSALPRTDTCERKEKGSPRPKAVPATAQQQPALLQTAFAGLAPQRKGTTDLYTVAVAGWADQDVFVKELDGALASLGRVLPFDGRVVRLVNSPETIRTTPLATRDNLAAAVRAVGERIDKDEDVLILFMTSHGSPDGFALQLPGAKPVGLPPREVARMLNGAGIKNRVVIVSACYSGIFVKPLANDTTIVMTAADEKNPSFGCAPGRDWTYFGDALFNRTLRPGMDFRRAFNDARNLISGWELQERLRPSNPQGHFGTALVEKLDPLFAAMAGAAR